MDQGARQSDVISGVKPLDIATALKGTAPGLFGKIADKRAAKIIGAVLAHVAREIANCDEGTVRVAGLGAFQIKNVERGEGAEKKTVRRVIFRKTARRGAGMTRGKAATEGLATDGNKPKADSRKGAMK